MPAEVAVMTPAAVLWAHEDRFVLAMPGKDLLVQARRAEERAHKEFLRAMPSSLAAGICEESADGYTIPLEGPESQLQDRLALLNLLFARSKFVLKIKSHSTPGRPDFRYEASFYLHNRLVELPREGLVVWRANDYHLLTLQQAYAAATCEAFNALDPTAKSRYAAFASLYELQQQAVQEGSMVTLERFLQEEKIARPSTVDIRIEDDGVEARPYIGFADVNPEKLKKQFWNHADAQRVYDIVEGQGRTRVLLNEETMKVADTVRRHAAGFRGKARDRILRDPRSLVEGDAAFDDKLIGVVGYGPRVLGLGYPNTFQPRRVPTKIEWAEGDATASAAGDEDQQPPSTPATADAPQAPEMPALAESLSLDYAYTDGTAGSLTFPDAKAANAFLENVEQAVARGEPAVEVDGVSVEASLELVDRCRKSWRSSRPSRRLALIPASNEEDVAYQELGQGQADASAQNPVVVSGMRAQMQLRPHQLEALAWLQRRMVAGGRGALLADDMGLGKTATLLALGSWAINSYLAQYDALNGPMLIVCPRVLLNVWKSEVQKFFEPEAFGPVMVLYGDVLKAIKRKKEPAEASFLDAASALNIEQISQHKLVVTNYNTLNNYHLALAKIPWSIVVVDEAQAIKNPTTKISSAVRCLRSEFRVACTGTPVETTIDNFWAIMDFVTPGDPLKSLAEFHDQYAQDPLSDALLDGLREKVGYNTAHGLVMRRRKEELPLQLPKKTIVQHTCEPDEIYAQQIAAVMRSEGKSLNLAIRLAGLTQHPYIDTEDASVEADPERLLSTSPKLRKTMEILRSIQADGDKALIFATRRMAMRFLHAAIWHTFSLNARIINGEVSDDDHEYRHDTRKAILKTFEESSGFDVLILSPEVAGVGLTITSANHVIHYARPWNPAKEAQSSDRVYRMGQLKDVSIHYVMYVSAKEDTFDQKLDKLLSSRTSKAEDFLRPWGDEKSFGEALGRTLHSSTSDISDAPGKQQPSGPVIPVDPASLSPENFEAFVALVRQAQGESVILTPRSHDRALDVIGVSRNKVSLIQCKTRKSGYIDVEEAVLDLKAGEEHLTSRISRTSLGARGLESVLAVNASVDHVARSRLKQHDIVLLDLDSLRRDASKDNLSESMVLACAAARCKSLAEVNSFLKSILKDQA